MKIVAHGSIEGHALPGLSHKTVAGPQTGTALMEVWMQTIAPGSATPPHRHDCEEVVLVLQGSGTCTVQGEADPKLFGPKSTLIFSPNEVHQIINTGTEDMHLVAALSMAPVRVLTADGTHIPLPWDQVPAGT